MRPGERDTAVIEASKMRINSTVKGIIIGLLTFGMLQFGTICIFAYLNNYEHWDFGGIAGIIKVLLTHAIVLVVTALLGVAIALNAKSLKRTMIWLTIVLAVIIMCGVGYGVWHIFSLPPPDPNTFD